MSADWHQAQELLDQQEQLMMPTATRIAGAFVKAKRSFGPALKDKTNPAFRSKYADLGACIDAVEDALLENGIAFIQETSEDPTGVTVETVFLHESGEVMRCGKLHVPAAKQDPQGYGSALTYARRYSLMASCGIAPEDDDGNAASKTRAPTTTPAPAPKPETKQPDPVEMFGAERAKELTDMAAYMIESHEAGKDLEAITLINDPQTFKETDEKLYVWNLLKPYSKLRTAINANSRKGQA